MAPYGVGQRPYFGNSVTRLFCCTHDNGVVHGYGLDMLFLYLAAAAMLAQRRLVFKVCSSQQCSQPGKAAGCAAAAARHCIQVGCRHLPLSHCRAFGNGIWLLCLP
jgi:hypothetical protein